MLSSENVNPQIPAKSGSSEMSEKLSDQEAKAVMANMEVSITKAKRM
jgi:hypothetical protein